MGKTRHERLLNINIKKMCSAIYMKSIWITEEEDCEMTKY